MIIKELQNLLEKFPNEGYGDQLGNDPDDAENQEDQSDNDTESEQENQDDDNEDNQEGSEDSDASSEQLQEDEQDSSQGSASQEDMAESESDDDTELPEGDAPTEPPTSRPHSAADPNYTVYSTNFDEEIRAEDLADSIELERLRAYLDQQLEPLKGAVSRLANKLQRRLQAQQNRSWEFDLEEGLLDVSKLTRVIPIQRLHYHLRSKKILNLKIPA